MNTLGLDLSLTGTGVIILKEDGSYEEELIRSKPTGKKLTDELERIMSIRDRIKSIIRYADVKLVALEGMAYAVRNTQSLVQLAGLNYMVREALYRSDIPFIIVAPSTLKKFVTGKGNCPKDIMMLETFQRFGASITDNNLCDAFGLAHCAMAVLGKSPIKLIKPQEETVNLLKTQYLC